MAAPAAAKEQGVPLSASSPELKKTETGPPSPSSSQLNLEEDDDEAPLLPHERIDQPPPPPPSHSPSSSPASSPEQADADAEMRRSTSAPAELSSSRSSSSSSSSGLADTIRGTLARATARRLQRRSTTKEKSADERSQTAPPPPPSQEDLIREARAALDQGPRDPTLSTIVSAMLSAPLPTTTTTNTSPGGVSSRDFAPVQQLANLSMGDNEDDTSEQHSAAEADMSSYINAPSPQPPQRQQHVDADYNDDDVVQHPRRAMYMRPIKTIGPFGMWLHEFKRWQCCHCGCKTHYENHDVVKGHGESLPDACMKDRSKSSSLSVDLRLSLT
ncbi:hypothetical protein IWZ03DRAFT_360431 [Phyllosticta citriasiana]|uniref:Uncharacterized protein n=1 Tax=Phyllosticta citriasiana TaxID=595635 RepID=A0ABR1KLL0_9PEZI